MKKIIKYGVMFISAFPMLALAAVAPAPGTGTIDSIIGYISGILTFLVPVLITLAVVVFIIGVIQYMAAKDEEQKKKGRSKIVGALIGLFVIVAFWGIIAVVKRSFGIGNAPQDSIIPCTPHYVGGALVEC
jgi:hypothetical protein